jgi:transposase
MRRPPPEIIEMNDQKQQELLRRIEGAGLEEGDVKLVRAVFDSYAYLTELIDDRNTSLTRLRKLLFGARTEKTANVVGRDQPAQTPSTEPVSLAAQEPAEGKKGHGRNGADRYPGANRIKIPHESLKAGDPCPDCEQGTVYAMSRPGVLIRFVGQPPVAAAIYELEKLRCNLCGEIFTAQPPEGIAGVEKYDATVASMIALLKYGTGQPFHRQDKLQKSLGVPLPASTQWEIVAVAAAELTPASDELIRQAAQGAVVHNDDTTVKILELMHAKEKTASDEQDASPDSSDFGGPIEMGAPSRAERTGTFTSGIVATSAGHRIALFFSGRKHGGENLADVLRQRASDLPPPIQMCDALSRNLPKEFATIVANCLAHGRRQFVDVSERFPEETRYVLEALEVVYRNDSQARQRQMTDEDRLAFHQAESGPVMDRLRAWLSQQFDERRVEPNSGLGAAISYLIRHWEKLTLFLRQPGAPLDNNICERALKKAILNRKNAYFYKTQNGAAVGDQYMSLIHTCELNGVNPFDYLTALLRHADEVAAAPAAWMPWNYREALTCESSVLAM